VYDLIIIIIIGGAVGTVGWCARKTPVSWNQNIDKCEVFLSNVETSGAHSMIDSNWVAISA